MTTSDDFGVLLIHPEPDSLGERVVELLAAREPPVCAVWHLPSPPPQHHRTPTHARHGGQRGDKAARKAQKQARKANRSRK